MSLIELETRVDGFAPLPFAAAAAAAAAAASMPEGTALSAIDESAASDDAESEVGRSLQLKIRDKEQSLIGTCLFRF